MLGEYQYFLTGETVPFSQVPIGHKFVHYGELCFKDSESTAITPDCADGMTAGFRQDDLVDIVAVAYDA